MSSLMKKMLAPSKGSGLIKESSVLSKSKLLNDKDEVCTGIPMLNVALSGSISGGLTSGVTTIAAPSKHFKSNISLVLMKAYMDEHKDSVCLFYDSEFGSTKDYFSSLDIDPDRIIHIPIENIEDFKFDLAHRLKEQIERGDRVFIYVDSIGNLASKKELEDANDAKSVTDMTRAKALKALFRIITPQLTIRDIPMVCIAHVYDTQEIYSKKVVSGGCVVKGTKIQMFDGSLKQVEDILVGENVKTLEGSKTVNNIWNPDTLEIGEPECFEIEFDDNHKVTVSKNHKFLTTKGWVEAQNLIGDENIVNI